MFVFGLPRCGTTLTEQLLAGHSRIHAAGELELAGATFRRLGELPGLESQQRELTAQLDRERTSELAEEYLHRLGTLEPAALRIVDKMPDNYLYLGLLATLFPRAVFIHCRRNLRDVAVSCWMTNFRQIRWANDPDHIAARFAAYERLMQHSRAVLPVPCFELHYEQLVDDLEGTARQLIAWCGLEWEPQCLVFHERRLPVRTASVTQVRQPLYSRSVGRWQNYALELTDLWDSLRLPR